MAKIIVIGNEKGGSGKTTTAMHLIVSLLHLGFSVGSIDLDLRQQSLGRYVENRKKTLANRPAGSELPMPEHYTISKANNSESEGIELAEFQRAFQSLRGCDFIVIDTPGSDTAPSRAAHEMADLVITPINDSFIDVDLLGVLEAEDFNKIRPGIYSASLWEQKMKRAASKSKEMDWVVVRNRLSNTDAINKRKVGEALINLSKRFGFRIVPGFGDRVIFKELFLHGLTLLDASSSKEVRFSMSLVAARQELRDFIEALNIAEVQQKLKQQVVNG